MKFAFFLVSLILVPVIFITGTEFNANVYRLSAPTPPPILHVKPNLESTLVSDCSSWDNACDLQTAISIAIPGTEIWVAKGTYLPTSEFNREASFALKDQVGIYGGFNGTENDRDQRNPARNITILSGDLSKNDEENFLNNDENSFHVVVGYLLGPTAVLDGFTISGGNANGEYPHHQGGGIRNENGSPTLSNLVIRNNFAVFDGGGLSNLYTSNPLITNVNFSHNYAPYGGGMHNESGCAPQLINVLFESNTAGFGGGMDSTASNPTLTNVTFSTNHAIEKGGAISNRQGSSLTLINVTIYANTASMVGGINNLNLLHTHNTVEMTNCILWGNTDPQFDGDTSLTTFTISFSDIEGNYSGLGSNGNINEDPNLGLLSFNGGYSMTHPLLPGSSAIDSGSIDQLACPFTDQRGYSRPTDGNLDGIARCDMGAYEYQPIQLFFPVISR